VAGRLKAKSANSTCPFVLASHMFFSDFLALTFAADCAHLQTRVLRERTGPQAFCPGPDGQTVERHTADRLSCLDCSAV